MRNEEDSDDAFLEVMREICQLFGDDNPSDETLEELVRILTRFSTVVELVVKYRSRYG